MNLSVSSGKKTETDLFVTEIGLHFAVNLRDDFVKCVLDILLRDLPVGQIAGGAAAGQTCAVLDLWTAFRAGSDYFNCLRQRRLLDARFRLDRLFLLMLILNDAARVYFGAAVTVFDAAAAADSGLFQVLRHLDRWLRDSRSYFIRFFFPHFLRFFFAQRRRS